MAIGPVDFYVLRMAFVKSEPFLIAEDGIVQSIERREVLFQCHLPLSNSLHFRVEIGLSLSWQPVE
jgi:hypothetical protein